MVQVQLGPKDTLLPFIEMWWWNIGGSSGAAGSSSGIRRRRLVGRGRRGSGGRIRIPRIITRVSLLIVGVVVLTRMRLGIDRHRVGMGAGTAAAGGGRTTSVRLPDPHGR